jgi:hypothetical protein
MALGTGYLADPQGVDGGERLKISADAVLSTISFENGLKAGRFAKWASSQLDNMDGSSTPVIAGVVLRSVTDEVDDAGTLNTAYDTHASYVYEGLVTVDVKTGESPAIFGKVYASNDGDANDGLATTQTDDVPTGAIFLEEVKSGVWLVACGGATAIALQDVAQVTKLGTTSNVSDIALSTSDTYTDAAVNGAVNTAIAAIEARLDDIETAVDAVITAAG